MRRVNYAGNERLISIQTKKNRATRRPGRLYTNIIETIIRPHTNIRVAIHFDGVNRLINKVDGTVHKI